ncbi:hypothetical protein [Psychrobacillus sp. FJAT-51614]|uniref:hypothetical protein n=1 Tax=Psychrobacillus mangrovi TaxID=3117745 RepID=UPI0030140C85
MEDTITETDNKMNSLSEWTNSTNGLKQATIARGGELAAEEGETVLVIEYLRTNDFTIKH